MASTILRQWRKLFSEKLIVVLLVKQFPAFLQCRDELLH
jgi:hypothetical protein